MLYWTLGAGRIDHCEICFRWYFESFKPLRRGQPNQTISIRILACVCVALCVCKAKNDLDRTRNQLIVISLTFWLYLLLKRNQCHHMHYVQVI